MAARSLTTALLLVVSLVGTLLLGLAVWAAADSDEEPSSTTLAVADLEAVVEEPARARVEIVETGNRIWLKYQIRDLPYEASVLVLWVDSDEEVEVDVDGDGDYVIPNTTQILAAGRVDLRHADALVLTGTLEPPD